MNKDSEDTNTYEEFECGCVETRTSAGFISIDPCFLHATYEGED